MFVKRRLSACVALVGFCFSLLLVSIKPVFADDSSDYLLGYWTFSASDTTWGDAWLAGTTPPSEHNTSSGVNSIPFRGKNIGTGNSPGDYKVGSYIVGAAAYQTSGYFPDVKITTGFSNPQVGHNLHLIIKMGVGVGEGSVSHRDDALHGFWFVGDRAYTSSNAKITFIGTSAWSTGLNLSFSKPFEGLTKVYSDYTTGYCYRLDFDYQAQYGNTDKYAISGLGMYFEDYTSKYTTASNHLIGGLVGYLLAWADTGEQAIDSAITDILTHVAKIDGNVQSIYSALQSLLSIAKQIKIDTADVVKLLQSINSSTTLLQSDVAGIYDLLKNALADESASLDNKSQSAAEKIMQQSNGEQYWIDKNTDNFNALDFDNFSFSNGVVGALSSVGSLFSSVWNALGDAVVIFTFPLMLGIALVLVGRISRHSQKSNGDKGKSDSGSKGGDK
jgi:hypothetical protein